MDDDEQEEEQILEYNGDVLEVLSSPSALKPFHSAKKARSSLGDAARIFSPSKSASKMDVDTENSKENSVNLVSQQSRYPKTKVSVVKANERATPFSPRVDTGRSMTPSKRAVTPSKRPVTPSKPATPFRSNPNTPTKQPLVLSSKKPTKPATPAKASISPPSSKALNLELPEKAYKRDWDMKQFDAAVAVGKGKFGMVYHAKKSGKAVAVKVMSKSYLTDEHSLKSLQREVDIQYDLQHEHIVRMHGFFQDMRYVYLILDYAPGGEFYRYLRSLPNPALEEKVVKGYMKQIVSALAYMHAHHIVHRDLKPENIFIHTTSANSTSANGADGPVHKLVLGDFGSSVSVAEGLRFTICGTPEYLAPEVIVSAGHDCAVDMWGVGVLIYELLVGR